MADILIKGMEMPKTCANCPMCHYVTATCKALYTKEHGVKEVTLYWHDGRHPECPLVEVVRVHQGANPDAELYLVEANE